MNILKICVLLLACLMLASMRPPDKITVYLIGDSTMADKRPDAFPETGWGMPFKTFFDASVTVDNRAKNGRSTRSFIAENLWQPVVDQLKEGDYVFIQFGHNDEVKSKTDRYTNPQDFKKNLVRFITETRSKKAIPVLLTPVTRRQFDDAGKVRETHPEYSPLVAEVAKETNVAFIDLDQESRSLLQQFGPEDSRYLFMQLKPGEHPNYPDGRNDNTHFSQFGARKIAQLVLKDIVALHLDLAGRIVQPAKKSP
ncbi:MAG TPA: rhamnogalacturonan acetylesterase [Chryseosolibacter sp.]|jgi:lysophospholipase L1-like esterase|nr:rhamnogalacturonan acetylesterase [Chryseosolibacter sp.]